MLDYRQAKDELFGMVNDVLTDPTVNTLLGYLPDVRWPDQPLPKKPAVSLLWARVSMQNVTDGQVSLTNINRQTLYEATGLLYVQLFCPRNIVESVDLGTQVAQMLRAKFVPHSPSGELWFRKQKVVELPANSDSTQINVVVQYTYKTLESLAA